MINRVDILNMPVGDQLELSQEVDVARIAEGWLYSLSNSQDGLCDLVMVPDSKEISSDGDVANFVEAHENIDVLIVPGGKIYGMWYAIWDDARAQFVDMVKRLGGSMEGNRAQGKLFSKIVEYMESSEAENIRRHVFVPVD